mmetsp:Transcript_8558/g.13125  ORF Transcript_8558/g.13125 Transcript_8558/m.13125 type:complete len:257 (-) Transcript_8558:7-777(-)
MDEDRSDTVSVVSYLTSKNERPTHPFTGTGADLFSLVVYFVCFALLAGSLASPMFTVEHKNCVNYGQRWVPDKLLAAQAHAEEPFDVKVTFYSTDMTIALRDEEVEYNYDSDEFKDFTVKTTEGNNDQQDFLGAMASIALAFCLTFVGGVCTVFPLCNSGKRPFQVVRVLISISVLIFALGGMAALADNVLYDPETYMHMGKCDEVTREASVGMACASVAAAFITLTFVSLCCPGGYCIGCHEKGCASCVDYGETV